MNCWGEAASAATPASAARMTAVAGVTNPPPEPHRPWPPEPRRSSHQQNAPSLPHPPFTAVRCLCPAWFAANLERRGDFRDKGAAMETEVSFEHEATFDHGEVSGQLKLGKFEEQYEELFAEVIEDGIITAEERARLDKVADSFGLDRQRLHQLEQALQAAYESRHHVQIRDLSDEQEAPASIAVHPTAARDPHLVPLDQQVANLTMTVADLQRQLERAGAREAVEGDLSNVRAAPAASQESPEPLT